MISVECIVFFRVKQFFLCSCTGDKRIKYGFFLKSLLSFVLVLIQIYPTNLNVYHVYNASNTEASQVYRIW